MSLGPRPAARLALGLVLVTIGRTVAAAPIDQVEVILVAGSPRCPPQLRDVVAEQLADMARDAVWVCREGLDPEEAFGSAAAGAGVIRITIDVRPGTEARLTFGDTRSDRFVVRRVPLRNGLDELGREEIGQIVRFGALALRDGSSPTLSRTEARAAVATWPAPAGRVTSPSPGPEVRRGQQPGFALDVGPIWSVSMFSTAIPVVQELAVGATVRTPVIRVWPWIEAGYQLPATHDAEPIGVELSAATLRFGLASGQAATRSLSFSGGAGVALERASFVPIGASASVEPAAADSFWTVGGRVMVGGQWRPTARLAIGVRLVCDIAGADVHYDLRGSDGAGRRVLTAFRIAPGVGLGVAWRL